MNSTTTAPTTTTSSSSTATNNNTSNVSALNEMDERQMSLSAVKAAEDKLQQLCASHAATFVAVEHRGAALTSSLQTLLQTIDKALPNVRDSQSRLQEEEEKEESQEDNGNSNPNPTHTASATLTSLAEKHRLRRRTLLQHSSLLELLELPNLMDACVRGHLYEEALSIASFANTLERYHLEDSSTFKSLASNEEKDELTSTPISTSNTTTNSSSSSSSSSSTQYGNPVVWNVVTEVRKRESDLHRHLLHRLRTEVSMPVCLEVVTALRRLNAVELDRTSRATNNISATSANTTTTTSTSLSSLDLEQVHNAMEFKLQVLFLENRDVWLDGTTAAMMKRTKGLTTSIASGNADVDLDGTTASTGMMASSTSETLLDSIDAYRTRCFEITTQFLAIFRASTSSNTQQNASLQLLSMWTSRRIQLFLQTHLSPSLLTTYITDTSILRDVYEATIFFATSMGRIGADFSPLLPSIFEPRCVCIVTGHWKDGVDKLNNILRICREAGVASPLFSTTHANTIQEELAGGEGKGTVASNKTTTTTTIQDYPEQSKTLTAPRQLLSYPPLARLVNAFLTGLNELRRCLFPQILTELRTTFQTHVTSIKNILSSHQRAVLTPGFLEKGEDAGKLRSLAGEYLDEFGMCVEPYLSNSLEIAFGSFENVVEPPPEEEVKENVLHEEEKVVKEEEKNIEGESNVEEDETKPEEEEEKGADDNQGKEISQVNDDLKEGQPLNAAEEAVSADETTPIEET